MLEVVEKRRGFERRMLYIIATLILHPIRKENRKITFVVAASCWGAPGPAAKDLVSLLVRGHGVGGTKV